jgi:dipeptidyl aminopeptidase/acylaminoacyl peptidase
MARIHRAHILAALLVLLLPALVGVAHAQSEVFSLEQVMSAPFPSALTAARQGSRIAWVFDAQGKRNIWVAEGPKFAARQLTPYKADDGQEITDVQFAGDAKMIVYVRGGNKNQAGEVPNPTSDPGGVEQAIWVIAWKGGAPRKIDLGRSPVVTPRGNWVAYLKENQLWVAPLSGKGKPAQIIARGQNGAPIWSPDGSKLAFLSNRTTHSWIGIYDPVKKTVGFVAPTVDRDLSPRWSPDSKSVAFIRLPARPVAGAGGGGGGFFGFGGGAGVGPWAIWIADVTVVSDNIYAAGRAREVWQSSPAFQGTISSVAGAAGLTWAGDDRFIFPSEQDGWQHLYSLPATGGTPALLTPGECEVEQFVLTPDRRTVVYSTNCGDIDRRHIWRVSVTSGAPEQLTTGEGIEMSPTVTGDAKWLAFFSSDAQQPNMPFVRAFDATGKGQMLAAQALPKDFPSANLVVPQQVIIDAPDGMKIHNQLFLPPGARPGARYPAVIFMHGGPMRQMLLGWHYLYYYRNAYAFNQYLASRGYVVLSVNFRSGIGYGRAFRMAQNRGAAGASEYQDIVAAGKYLASRPDVDATHIGLWGGSYGGYLTAMGLARNSDMFAAGVDLHGVHDWSMRQLGPGAPTAAAPTQAATDRARLARESSPVAAVDKWKSPVLIIQGDDDRNVDFDQMVDLVPRLRQEKVAFEQIVFPDEVHDFLLHRHWVAVYHAASDFFDRHLKSAAH